MGVDRPVLVTGFEPFLRHRRNSSWEAVKELDGVVMRGRRIVVRRLPVSFARAGGLVRAWIRELRPGAVVCFGLAEEGKVRLEAVAVNVDHAEKPDNDGRRRWDRPILAGRPLALRTRLPLAAIERRLRRGGWPVRRSFHAGTYLCNHVFYQVLSLTRVPAGFVHVPPLASGGKRKGRMGLGRLCRLARAVIESVVAVVD